MRIVDDSLGTVICMLLGWIVRIKHVFCPFQPVVDSQKVKTILCQKYFGMGSILYTAPLINGLRTHYPNAKIIYMTFKSNQDFVRLARLCDDLLVIREESFGLFIKDVFGCLLYLLRQRIDVSIDFEFFSKFTMIISLLSMAKIRAGLHQKGIRPEGIMTHSVYYNHYKHISDIYFAFGSVLGIERKNGYFDSLLPSLKDFHEKTIREKLGMNGRKSIIIINVNAGELFKYRCWPADYFAKLIQLLIDKYPDNYYVMIGVKSEYEYVEGIFKRIQHKRNQLINCAGKSSLEELFALIEMSYLMITNDSGPLHIAAAYGKNIAAFYGPETPIVYGPLNRKDALVFYSENFYCSPCLSVYDSKKSLYSEVCGDNVCMSEIKPHMAFEKICKAFLSTERKKDLVN
tara:strand:+ start:381 stop:1586 length:1206 start_codon:yes stop_codon:yes gene_type:complete